MRTPLRASALGLGLGALALAGVAFADTQSDVTAAYKAWDAAFNKGDAKAIAAFYTADGKVLAPAGFGGAVTGPAAIEGMFGGFIKAGVKDHELKVITTGGDGKMVYGTANWSAKGGDGKPVGGIATHIFERQGDGSWKLKVHTFN